MLIQVSAKRPKLQMKKRELLDLFESMPGRVELLSEQERTFVRLFMASQKIRPIAISAGKHEATIARKLKKIAARISGDNFVAALSDENLSPTEMQILREYFIDGVSMLKIARNKNLKYSSVRKIVKSKMAVQN